MDESTFTLEMGDISPVVSVVGNGGTVAKNVANANSHQLQPNCEMNVH